MLSQREILEYLERLEREIRELKEKVAAKQGQESAQSLYGIWKDKFPEDLDVDKALQEIRFGWKGKLDKA